MSAIGPVALALALVAGVVSFTSPCCLPLMPGYVAYVSGVAAEGGGSVLVRRRVLGAALLFVLGFATVFTLLGAGASAAGAVLLRNRLVIEKVAGAFVIAMGLVTMGLLRIPVLYREARLDFRRIRTGPLGAVPLGMAFAIRWTPCIGRSWPGSSRRPRPPGLHGPAPAFCSKYSLGLGIPFLLLAWGQARATRAFGWFRRHGRAIERVGGAVLLLMGVLMIAGQWTRLFISLIRWFARSGWPPI
jgi:cytochrome c-type biogenesis protein